MPEFVFQVATALVAIYGAILATLNLRAQRARDTRQAALETRLEARVMRVRVDEEWHEHPRVEVIGDPVPRSTFSHVLVVSAVNHGHRPVSIDEVGLRPTDGSFIGFVRPATDRRAVEPGHGLEENFAITSETRDATRKGVVPYVRLVTGEEFEGTPMVPSDEVEPPRVKPPTRASW